MLNIEPSTTLLLLFGALVLTSSAFGYYVAANPPKEESNPFAVMAGILMVCLFLIPSLIIAHRTHNEFLIITLPIVYPTISIVICGSQWVLRFKIQKLTEEVASLAYNKLNGIKYHTED